ncbi:MAG: esterase/lipase family protein [Achromobacter sp.]|uniref:esterase/lipase family protein n=1 Tax=unclassified Achromobacter TaxID=2626865 RepID=UPI0006F82847|nr:alpha/beta fold hydrolase [Achromobacter sp. Root565]KRA02088.1 hypothetical protein ASD71_08580 [Achromobacter sp. Root565]
MMASDSACINRSGGSRYLAVFFHGLSETSATMHSLIAALRETPDGADTDVFVPDLPFRVLSREDPTAVLAKVVLQMDHIWNLKQSEGRPYEKVLLVGHSMGSLYARKLYVVAMGEIQEAPFEGGLAQALGRDAAKSLACARPWGMAIHMIVLLAGMNRGWRVSHHMSLHRGVAMSVGLVAGRLIQAFGGRPFIVMSAHQGAPFITQLRLQWLALRERMQAQGRPLAHVVQLLGTQDDLVPPSANIDPVTGSDFSYLEVPRSGHASVVFMGREHGAVGAERKKVFQRALLDQRGESGMVPLAIAEIPPSDPEVSDVVFVMHGIRDLGYWTEKIGQRVAAHAASSKNSRKVALETSTYGYFPLLSFLRPGARQAKVEWLMDRVTEAKARFPNARLSYIGHSHGTYLLAKAMKDYPAVSFKHVVLAGSVLRTDQDWPSLIRNARVEKVLSFTASADWVVAFFPNAMQRIQWQDVGGAGHYGFSKQEPGLYQLPPPNRYVSGGHSAALDENSWDSIAEFVLDGSFVLSPKLPVQREHARWVAAGAVCAPFLWLLIAAILIGGGWLIVQLDISEWLKTLTLSAYIGLIWFALTKF